MKYDVAEKLHSILLFDKACFYTSEELGPPPDPPDEEHKDREKPPDYAP